MLPLQQAYEVKHSILEYLKATFSFKDKAVHEAFYRFIDHPEDGVFKGPYISLKLPFVKTPEDFDIPLEIKPDFPPYDHQYKAFQRLHTTGGHVPRSTLITTGTSSGKTECFLYPALDYCHKNIHRQGIKVIILYPMNALATDQAKRLAEVIWNDPRLKGKLTAGLFIGEGKNKKKFPKDMGKDHVIENRDSIVDSPPDILLTNFKMLDYALLRNHYHNLWTFNLDDPSLLNFLVLDELHTYDGAQGTDVANLVRRLKLKLGIEKGQVCAIGTSATIGSGDESKNLLIDYAEKVFGEEFDEQSVLVENREPVDVFFNIPVEELETFIPRKIGLLDSRLKDDETYEKYISRQKRLWQLPEDSDQVALGKELKKLKIVRDLVDNSSQNIIRLDELLKDLAELNREFRRLPEWDEESEMNPREEVINSLLALISDAKIGGGKKFPFLFLQIQLWIRELSGVLRMVGTEPVFTWKDKAGEKYEPKALPSYYCRECGASGWLAVKDDNKNHFFSDPNQVYENFFSNHKNIYLVNTSDHKHIDEYEPTTTINDYVNSVDLSLNERSGEGKFPIHAVRKLRETKSRHICPECNTENTLGIIGTRVATLSSITVSQVLASDLDPRTEKHRKILAFTNSVQDAAHQAGFVEARNYRFTFRASLQKVLNELNTPMNIAQLQAAFISFWKEHADETGENNEEAYFYRFFPADYKGKADLDKDYRSGKKFSSEFRQEFDERMRWEIISEYGYNALIGRTLEKSGASAVKFDENLLNGIYPAMKVWLGQNNLEMISQPELLPFVNGILHRIRIRGGVDHEFLGKFRSNNLKLWDLNWLKDNRHFLNRTFGPRSRIPKPVTTQPHNRGVLDSTFTTANNWFRNYYIKSFQLAGNNPAMVNDFFQKLFEVFAELKIMNKMGNGENENYAILPTAIIVENKVKHHACNSCGSVLNLAASDRLGERTLCLDYSCKTGVYQPQDNIKPNYYQLVYNRQRSPRIYAAEHTGLLERKDREDKEIDFKERPRFNSLNTIVATSTLEMGIDIGTLNTAINNSVPPLTSNFLQRVGRAGRASGSALVATFSQSKAHDLFYYEEPLDMMEGEVSTPGCFLEAKDILFRHFFAFCLDCWSSKDPKNNSIPGRIITLRLINTDLGIPEFLPNRIISFVKANEKDLLDRFIGFYKEDLEDLHVLDLLREFLLEETFYIRIKRVFERLKEEYLSIHEKRADIDNIIKSQKLAATDEERKALEREKSALWGLKRIIDKRSILEHMTNVGLLPNYAFPETGVSLNAWVKSNQAKASSSIPGDQQFEIVRASSVALKEFAPGNYFYSQGFKFAISGLNTFDWKDPGILLRKRFCSNCDHIANAAFSNEPRCPKCGDASWSSAKNEHVFVKLSSVKSANTREMATLDDSSDDRVGSNYRTSRHVKFDSSTFQGAWGMKEIPFGIEYVKNVEITEVNLGSSKSVDANKISINKQENIPFHGFVTCRYCGKSSSEPFLARFEKNFKFHYGYCKHKDKEYQGVSDEVYENVYLFREMRTEALKVLLPVQEFEGESQVNMFRAGLELGLKKYYKGNPQHLNIIDYSEYNVKTARFDRYLVIHDNIPGGTGYLEKLFNPAEFTDVIKKAYTAIKECACQFKGKDGCYRCIFTYTNQYIQEELSREKAEKLFKKIVEKSDAWENFSSGLGSLSGNGQIEESELEDRFIRSIRNIATEKKEEGWLFEESILDSVMNYKLKIVSGKKTFTFFIRPQFELCPSDGVRFRTRSDFYFTLTSITDEENPSGSGVDIESAKDIAIYLDGYTYHATKENPRFWNDLQKRLAIRDSGKIISWTLTWADLEKFDSKENHESARDSLFLDRRLYTNTIRTYEATPYWNSLKSDLFTSQNSMERLLWMLCHPLQEDRKDKRIALFLSQRQRVFGSPSADQSIIHVLMADPFQPVSPELKAQDVSKGNFFIFPENSLGEPDFAAIKTAVKLSDLSLLATVMVKDERDNLEKDQWERFWQLFNLVQETCELIQKEVVEPEVEEPETQEDKYDCLKYHDEELHDIIKQLVDHDIPFGRDGGFFLELADGYAEAMLGFHDQKIAIRPLSENDHKEFIEAGFKVIEPNDFNINDIMP